MSTANYSLSPETQLACGCVTQRRTWIEYEPEGYGEVIPVDRTSCITTMCEKHSEAVFP